MNELEAQIYDIVNHIQKVIAAPDWRDYLRRQSLNVVSTVIEPGPLSFSPAAKKAAVRVVGHMKSSSQDIRHCLRPTCDQITFLCASTEFLDCRTSETGDEWLIVGLGQQEKDHVVMKSYYKVSGSRHSIEIPDFVKESIFRHTRQDVGHRAVIVHSHRENILTASLLGLPFASDADREQTIKIGGNQYQWIVALWGGRRQIMHYAVEGGQIKEYFLPHGKKLEGLVQDLKQILARHGQATR